MFWLCLHYILGSIPKCHFLLHLPPHCCCCFGSCLSQDSLVPGKQTHFLPYGRCPASYFTLHFPTWMKLKPLVVPAFQHSIKTPHREQLEWSTWAQLTPVLFSDSCWNLQAHPVSCHETHSQTARIHQAGCAVGPQPLTTNQNVAADISGISE